MDEQNTTEQQDVAAKATRATGDAELKAMAQVLKIVSELEPTASARVLAWVSSRIVELGAYGVMTVRHPSLMQQRHLPQDNEA